MTPVTLLSDIRDYPWTSLLAGLLPAKIAGLLPTRFQSKAAQIVPSASIAGHALTVVIAITSFLACLTLGAVYMDKPIELKEVARIIEAKIKRSTLL